jgi:CRISPR-associated protein Csb1
MALDLSALDNSQRLLFEIPLQPLQGQRFQPTGFPALGAATFQTQSGTSLLVESAQSMANRLELMVWDDVARDVKEELKGISHVRVVRGTGGSKLERDQSSERQFFTDSILEAHRINSPYVMLAKHGQADVFEALRESLNVFEVGPMPSRSSIAKFLLQWDVGSLIHGVFLSAKKGRETLAGGRLRIPRALSAFIEADGVRIAASGGVKNDHVNPSGDTSLGYGNVPFARDEFTAERITLYVNIDLAQIRGYGLGEDVERLLILLALYKLRALIDQNLRLRTACDFRVVDPANVVATHPQCFTLPSLPELRSELCGGSGAIEKCKNQMVITEVVFNDDLKKGNESAKGKGDDDSGDVDD